MPPKTAPRLVTLVLLVGLGMLAQNMVLPALPAIADDLGTGYGTVSLVVSGYLALTALLQLVIGPLADRIGRRPVLLGALTVFALASIGCALAPDIETLLAFRALQASAVACSVLSIAILRDTTPPAEVATRLATLSSAMALAPILAPVLGGMIGAAAGWRAIFWCYVGAGGLALAIVARSLAEPDRPVPQPGGARTLLRSPAFLVHAGCGALSVGAFFLFITGAPLVAAETFGLPQAALGLVVGSITVGFLLGSLTTARLGARIGPRLMLIGRLVACGGLTLGLLAWAAMPLPPAAYFAATICVGIGNGLTMPMANAGALAVRPDRAATATGLLGFLSLATGAALTGIGGWLVAGPDAAGRLLALMLASSTGALLLALAAERIRTRAMG